MNKGYATFAKKLNDEIKCPNLKEILFGISDINAKDLEGIGAINRVLTFGFVTAFVKWRNDSLKGRKLPCTPNAKRVFDAFSLIYNGETIGLDLMVYILTEMQMDEMAFGERSYFRGIISSSQGAIQIPSLRILIKTWFQSAKHAERDQNILLEKLTGLCNAFPFLFNTSASFRKEDNVPFEVVDLSFKNDREIIDSHMILIKNDYGFYYLSSYEYNGNQSKLVYQSLNGMESYHETLATHFFRQRAAIRNDNTTPSSIFAKSLFSMSFKYIKNLSLSISDAITPATKQKIYEHFSLKYNDVFELGFKTSSELLWDNIITILIIEEGPTELLEIILDSDGFYFENILENLEVRYNSVGFANNVKQEYDTLQREELAVLKNHNDDCGSIIKSISTINRTLMAKGIIDGLASLESNKKKSNAIFVESLAVRIKNVDKIIASTGSNKSKVLKINKALEKTFRFMIPFYKGVIAYQQEKENQLNKIDTDKDDKKGEALFEKCEDKFFEVAEKSISEISKLSLGKLVMEFRLLCKSVVQMNGRQMILRPEGQLLRGAIGREYICSLDTFEKLIEIKTDDSMADLDRIPKDIINYINIEKHDKGYDAVRANIALYNKFLISVKQLLFFFIYNEDFEKEMILGQQMSYDPVYPYVVRYSTKSENRDGYKINSFTVFPSEESMRSEIKILSERDYEINERYYCIPSENTSNSRWWIEPFLISCRKYDKLIHSYIGGEDKAHKEGDE